MKKILITLTSLTLGLSFSSLTNVNAQTTYCTVPAGNLSNYTDFIDSVAFAGITNQSGDGASAYENFTSLTPGQVTIGQASPYTIRIESDEDEYVTMFIDWNQNGILNDPGEVYVIASGTTTSGPITFTGNITPPASALPGNTRMRIMIDWLDENLGDPCLGVTAIQSTYGEVEDYTINVSTTSNPITSLTVSTVGGAAASINTNAGTLQMQATILPATASQSVTWSIVPNTGAATISATGLVTATANGTVWAKAVSTQNPNFKDSLSITISNQTVPITGITVSTQGNVAAAINTNAGTLQMTAAILPAAANQNVTWSIVPGTGTATISSAGLVTAATNGTVWAKAISTQDISFSDSLEITLTNQGVGLRGLFSKNNVDVYPIPFDNKLIVDLKATELNGLQYQLSNLLGQVIEQKSISNSKVNINTSSLSAGIYVLSLIEKNGQVSSIKVVKD